MAEKIARGNTGPTTLVSEYLDASIWTSSKSTVDSLLPSIVTTWWINLGGGFIADNVSPNNWSNQSSVVTVPSTASLSASYILKWYHDGYIESKVEAGTTLYRVRWINSTNSFEVVCITEVVTVGKPTWNSSTNKWDYPVTITGQGGTPPYSSTPASSTTVSLLPGTSTTLSSTTTDSSSPQCSASSSTPIGPAKIPPGPPVEGEGPSVDEDDSDFFLIDYPITGNPTCPLTTNQMKAKPQTTGNVTSTSSSKKPKSSSTYGSTRSTGLIDTSEEALKGKLKIGVGL